MSKKYPPVSSAQESQLIDEVQLVTSLWDMTDSNYKAKQQHKKMLWDGIADRIEGIVDGEHAKNVWTALRDKRKQYFIIIIM